MRRPIFVSFEGGEGVGKTTQVDALLGRLGDAGILATMVREPGTTPLGLHLRDYLKGKQPLSKEAELLLFEAARAELVVSTIKPTLERGVWVIADRFEASSIAYQGWGRRIELSVIHRLNSFATDGLFPEITFLLDIEPAEGLRRIGRPQLQLPLEPNVLGPGREDVEGHRRFEDQPLRFHERVRQGFLDLAREDPSRWIVVDAGLPPEEISDIVWHHVLERLEVPPAADYAKVQPLFWGRG